MGLHVYSSIIFKMEQHEDIAVLETIPEVKSTLLKKKFQSCENLFTNDLINARINANNNEMNQKLKAITRSKSSPLVSNNLLKKKRLKRCGNLYTEAIINNKIKANKNIFEESIFEDAIEVKETDQEIVKQIDLGFKRMFEL